MLKVNPVVPSRSVLQTLTTDGADIVSNRHVEILPESQVSYSPDTNSKISFHINSHSEFMDMLDSYFRLDLNCNLTDGFTNVTAKALNQGGALALFRDITIRTGSGTLLERIDRHNMLYNIMSNASHSPEHVDSMLAMSGDSIGIAGKVLPCSYGERIPISDVYIDTAGGGDDIQNGSGANFTIDTYLKDGDTFELREKDGTLLLRDVVNTLTAGAVADNGILFKMHRKVEAKVGDPGAGSGVYLYKVSKECVRKDVANHADATLTFKPFSGLFKLKQWLPLFLMKSSIVVELNLERSGLALTSGVPVENAYASDYTIDNPRLFARMIKPSESLKMAYQQQFNSDEGISYKITAFRHVLSSQSGAAGSYNEPIHVNARSVRSVFSVIRPNAFESNNGTLSEMDKIGDFHKARVDTYQYVAGADRFPQREVDCRGKYANEALTHYVLAMNKYGSTIFDLRFDPHEWYADNWLPSTNVQDSKKFVMAVRTDRGSDFTGYDASVVPINQELTFGGTFDDINGTQQSRVISTFAAYDQILNLSAKHGFRVLN